MLPASSPPGEYLRKIGAETTAGCHHCEAERDTAQHTVAECQAFGPQRERLVAIIGEDLSPMALVKALLHGSNKQKAVEQFCEEVLIAKETAERDRERTNEGRRRRQGRPPNAIRQRQTR